MSCGQSKRSMRKARKRPGGEDAVADDDRRRPLLALQFAGEEGGEGALILAAFDDLRHDPLGSRRRLGGPRSAAASR